MRILQQHLDFIEYEPISKEIAQAEPLAQPGKQRFEEVVALFTTVERGDDAEVVRQAVEGIRAFLQKLKVNRVIIYPYAHLSQDLARPDDALEVLKVMERMCREAGLETYRAPFGWNKAFQIRVKGHPLAEQSRRYPASPQAGERQVRQPEVARREHGEMTQEQMLARVKKSDFAGLPETDHRIIGERLDLFSFHEPSPGMVFWHHKGVRLRNSLIEMIRAELVRRNYIEISAPTLANTILWKVSGHWDHYKDNMFLTMLGDEQFALKPMGCPSAMLYYRSRRWSFRDLPLRVSDFDSLYRNELSGVASGLFRVKMLTQDDAHIFAAEEQVESEIKDLIDLFDKLLLGIFKLPYKLNISTMPDDHIGTKEKWDQATETLIRVVTSRGLPYSLKEKEGAFYGPKIDVDIQDSMGREWQCSTIQLDYQLPVRFNLSFVGSDGKEHTPVVIHRAIFGSLERFIGIIIEHFQGKFPLWLAPVQVKVLSVSDESTEYAAKIAETLAGTGLRVEKDLESGTVGSKIRAAQLQKIPYAVVIGSKEKSSGTIAVRSRDGQVKYGLNLDDFVEDTRRELNAFS